MCTCPHSTTFRMGRWHQPWLAVGLAGTRVLWHEIQNWPKAPAISWWDPGSLVPGGSYTSSCCCLGVILVAALLVLLFLGELLWKSRRAQFPQRRLWSVFHMYRPLLSLQVEDSMMDVYDFVYEEVRRNTSSFRRHELTAIHEAVSCLLPAGKDLALGYLPEGFGRLELTSVLCLVNAAVPFSLKN